MPQGFLKPWESDCADSRLNMGSRSKPRAFAQWGAAQIWVGADGHHSPDLGFSPM